MGRLLFYFVLDFLLICFAQNVNISTKVPTSGVYLPGISSLPSTAIPLNVTKPSLEMRNSTTAKTKRKPEEMMQQPSLLTLRAYPDIPVPVPAASMAIETQPVAVPLPNVRSITATSPGFGMTGSVNYITVEADVPIAGHSYQAPQQSYMKRYPHVQYATVDLPPLLPAELRERADHSLKNVDQLFNRVEPELLKSGVAGKVNGSAAMHFGRSNARAKQLSHSALIALDISKSLAQDYHLTREQIHYALPEINIYGTVLGDVCAVPTIPPCSCKPLKFREIDGFCNNPYRPDWGRSFAPFQRFLPAAYDDGIDAPRAINVNGNPLPSARLVSMIMHPDVDRPHCHYTLLLMHFGQFMDHDINHTPPTTLTGYGKSANIECCQIPYGVPPHPACFPIEIPYSDQFYGRHNLKCMNFVRSEIAPRPGCALGPREQLNQLTSFLDGSQIYGSTYEDMKNMRTYQYGRLRTVFVDYCHKDVLPPDLDTGDCPDANATLPCFRAGDSRVNENTGLATVHTVFVREHNRIADELYYLNPHWDDERLFQEARKIVGAELQHITYKEWLPLILGKDVMYQNDLASSPTGYYEGYDKNINPTASNVFATAALRFGHTLIPSWFRFFNKHHEYIGQKQLRDAFFRPYPLYQPGIIDMYLLGMINDNIQKRDTFITGEVTEYLFAKPHDHGVDLAAINIQRGRDHGIPAYNLWREFCGLPKAYTFDDLKDVMRTEVVERFKTVYETVQDIDLFPAGVAEEPLHDGLLGPTFTCILTKQFVHLKRGDRFWYENDIQPHAFTPEQLQEIRRTSIARIICDNSDEVETIQPNAFLHVLPLVNERIPCKGPALPGINLAAWKEVPKESLDLKNAVYEAVHSAVYAKVPEYK